MTKTSAPLPKVLNMGSGKNFLPNALNCDISPAWNPDLIHDFNLPIPDGAAFETRRFGTVQVRHNSFACIIAKDVLEHIRELATAMRTCLDLLAPGGEMHIVVPYDLSYGAWQDPTHIRAFNERSWWYYTKWHWYLGWTEARFDLTGLDFALSDHGHGLVAKGVAQELLPTIPRAIDEMQVVLKKRALTPEEAQAGERLRRGGGAPGPAAG